MLAVALISALAPSVTTRGVERADPVPLAKALVGYENCLFDAIDKQFAAGRTAYFERRVLAACVAVRRTQLADALAASQAPGAGGPKRVLHKFAALDTSVWTIVGHLRARSAGRP